jgi:hypothetical protein
MPSWFLAVMTIGIIMSFVTSAILLDLSIDDDRQSIVALSAITMCIYFLESVGLLYFIFNKRDEYQKESYNNQLTKEKERYNNQLINDNGEDFKPPPPVENNPVTYDLTQHDSFDYNDYNDYNDYE